MWHETFLHMSLDMDMHMHMDMEMKMEIERKRESVQGTYLGVELLGCRVCLSCTFTRKCQIVFLYLYQFIFTPIRYESSGFSTFFPAFVIVRFKNFRWSCGYRIGISLQDKLNIKHLFTHSLAIHASLLLMPIYIFCLFFFSLDSLMSSIYSGH